MKCNLSFLITILLSTFVFGQTTNPLILTPISRIEKQVQDAFSSWVEKGEFEKTEAYKERIGNHAVRVFDSLCEHYIFSIIGEIGKPRDHWEIKYDADEEVFQLKYTYSYSNQDEFLNTLRKLRASIAVPIEQAPAFKQQNDRYLVSRPYGKWRMRNGYLIPSNILISNSFSNDSIASINVPLNDTKEIVISSGILSDIPQPLRDHSYRFTQVCPAFQQRSVDDEELNVNRNINAFKWPKGNEHGGSADGVPGWSAGSAGSMGAGYNMSGRSIRGRIPIPSYQVNKDGDVVVQIKVDRNGNVIEVEAPMKGSKNYDNGMVEAAKQAARKARFNSDSNAPDIQKGTITFKFRNKQ